MRPQPVYAFYGLGADARAFAALELPGYEVIHVEWVQPQPAEPLAAYVLRLAQQAGIPKSGAFVIGLSFGGICATELSKSYTFKKLLLISSAKTQQELPSFFGFAKILPLHKLIPTKFFTMPSAFLNRMFAVHEIADQMLLAAIIRDTDPQFMKWAIQAMLDWDNKLMPANCLHIHGDKDRVIPINSIRNAVPIQGAGHFMILNRASEISPRIVDFFASSL